MRRIVLAALSTLSGLVLLVSWQTGINRSGALGAAGEAVTPTGATVVPGPVPTGAPTTPGADPTAGAAPDRAPAVTGTFTGTTVSTRYGDVQVRITVADGLIASADAIVFPDGDRESRQISGYAVPRLNESTVAAQGAGIEMVSHATFTSNAYAASLQDALDQASL